MVVNRWKDRDRYEDRVVIALSFDFDDLSRRLVDDDLRFLWRFFSFALFCDGRWRKYSSSHLFHHGFCPVG